MSLINGWYTSLVGSAVDFASHTGDMTNPHNTDVGNLGSGTLAELNTLLSDAVIDATGDARTPLSHTHLLSDITDTAVSSPASGQFLKWNGSDWINAAIPGGVTTFAGLDDTLITSPASGELITYNGTNWINQEPANDAGTISNNYAFIYDSGVQTIASGSVFQDVLFSHHSEIDGWLHTSGTAPITCQQAGTYKVSATVVVEKTSGGAQTMGIMGALDGAEILGSYIGRDVINNNDQSNTGLEFLLTAISGQVLKLQMVASSTDISLSPAPNPGSALMAPSISLTICRIK